MINEQVVCSLVKLPREELRMVGCKQIFLLLKEFQLRNKVEQYKRGYYWAREMRTLALHRAGLSNVSSKKTNNKSPATTRTINAEVLDIFEDWNGPIPDCIVREPREELGGKIISTPTSDEGDIVKSIISKDDYLSEVPRGVNVRGVVKNRCYLESDQDESVCLQVDTSGEEDGELKFLVEGDEADVTIAQLPESIADRIVVILMDIFGDENDPNSLCLPREFLVNAHGMRGSPPRGRMTTFGLRELLKSGGAAYVNTLSNMVGKRGDLYAYLKEIEELLCGWLRIRYPDVLSDVQRDNGNYHGNKPPYIGEEEMIAPRIVISWQLGNEPHVNPKDNGVSVVVWLLHIDEIDLVAAPPDWRFVIQNIRTKVGGKQRDGISVQLFHGIVIIYDGKKIRHATSIPFDTRYTRFGVFHGSTNPRGYKKHKPSS